MKTPMPSQKPLTPLFLPTTLVDELKLWQKAFSKAYGRNVTLSEMIRTFIDFLPENEPDIVEELEKMGQKNPELFDKLGKYKGKI